jgi:2-polyprenyl-6-hydroxyphenyl methylase/3-demethylubiquinone-9 3-methyltransferase
MSPDLTAALSRFDSLPLGERLHVRARAYSCPLDAVAAEVPSGRIVDLGCGHGLLSVLLAGRADREVKGIDHDERKIALARSLRPRPNLSFAAASIDAEPQGSLDAVVIVDVLYLVRRDGWAPLLRSCVSRLKAGGRLVLKEADTRPAWKHAKTWLQEVAMARILGRTRGEAVGFAAREELAALLASCGLEVRVEDVSAGYTAPHVLFVGTRGPPAKDRVRATGPRTG